MGDRSVLRYKDELLFVLKTRDAYYRIPHQRIPYQIYVLYFKMDFQIDIWTTVEIRYDMSFDMSFMMD